MSKPVIVKVMGKDREAATKGIGDYELYYLRIHGAWSVLGQLEVCVDRHKTKLGLKWNAFCKILSPMSIQLLGWRVTQQKSDVKE